MKKIEKYNRIKLINIFYFVIIVILIICTCFIPLNATAYKYNDVEIIKDSHEFYSIALLDSGDTVKVEVTCKSDTEIDVYIMKDNEYSKYFSLFGENDFLPEVAKEKIKSTSFKWEVPDDESYYLVIDNKDNARDSDAVPEMDVLVDIEYKKVVELNPWICIIGLLVVIIIIVVVLELLNEKKKKQALYLQQPYQPPPQPIQQQNQRLCPYCNQSLSYISQYQRYWCNTCRKYI